MKSHFGTKFLPVACRRRGAWVKVKLTQEQEFVIRGYTLAVGGRKYFGGLPADRTCFLDLAGDPG